ncbi:MAG: GNAT family N-acetyltransferase [Lachnospiraceae bacterium]|jgi:ribosomal protein S18 acetylase RimI-like enzyme|nr:GNAT family N-acetyltransferase [Lachnospiraceae bacterium]
MNISITFAVKSDIECIAAFINQAWRATYADLLSPEYLDSLSTEKRSAALYKLYDSGNSYFLMLHINGDLIGAAILGKSLTEGYPDDGEITALYLRSDFIGRGFGHMLIERAQQVLTELGYCDFILDVFKDNDHAISFYETHGFKKVDERLLNLGGIEYPYILLRKIAKS